MGRGRGYSVAAAGALLAVVGLACGGPAATPTQGPTTVTVGLQEWAVLPSPATVKAGQVKFIVSNTGPNDVHEFVVVKTDLDINQLPTDADGAVDEAAGGMEVIDEIEDVAVGANQELVVTLEPGKYALICNIYAADENEAHYQMGMRAAFTVTQ